MRRSIATAGALVLGLVAVLPAPAQAAPAQAAPAQAAPGRAAGPEPGLSAGERAAVAGGIQLAPKAAHGTKPEGPNPYLANLADPRLADYGGWAAYLSRQGKVKAAAKAKAQAARGVRVPRPVVFDEDEPAGTRGGNDAAALAQRLNGFGTGAGGQAAIRILGALAPERVPITAAAPSIEDDGAIPAARDTGIGGGTVRGISTTGAIGDGPYGSAAAGSGDFDFYTVRAADGEVIEAKATATSQEGLDLLVIVYSADGEIIGYNDDADANTTDSLLRFVVPAAGTYHLAIVSIDSYPIDPFDSAAGAGAGGEGPYALSISAGDADDDFYAIKVRKGDVLAASVKGNAGYIGIHDALAALVQGSETDTSYLYPPKSPLPGGGNALAEHVVTESGWHYIAVSGGSGTYDVTVEAHRPVLEGAKPVQTLFLDFDGARVNTAMFGGTGVVQLSPFRAWLGRWGLTRADEDTVIDAIVASVTESLEHDLEASGLNNRFRLRVRNSRDHADPWGGDNVSRVIVGGSIDESGVPTIGIAQSIDPGNFDTEETALVLLDVLSEPTGVASLNTYLTGQSDRAAFVGQAVGNVTAHEAGHFFGNFHTDNSSDAVNLQDAGGANFQNLFGVGPDGIGGTADDPDVDFGHDRYAPAEGFRGTEDTLGRIAFGLTS